MLRCLIILKTGNTAIRFTLNQEKCMQPEISARRKNKLQEDIKYGYISISFDTTSLGLSAEASLPSFLCATFCPRV